MFRSQKTEMMPSKKRMPDEDNNEEVKFKFLSEKGNNVEWPYVDTQNGNNVDTLLGTKLVS